MNESDLTPDETGNHLTLTEHLHNLVTTKIVQVRGTAKELNCFRIMLRRKWDKYRIEFDRLGFLPDELTHCVLRSSIKDGLATFWLGSKPAPLRFEIIRPITKADFHEEVPTNLGQHQESTVQHGSSHQNPQEHGTDADPSCPQGESNGQCSTEEDWQSKLREFIEQDSE